MKRFFSSDSFWNQPLAADPAVDPRSDAFLQMLAGDCGGPFKLNTRTWTVPLFEVDERTPRRTVHQRRYEATMRNVRSWGHRENFWGHGPGFGRDVPIPDHAAPDPEEDGHLALVDWTRGLVWDMWGCRRRSDGEWESNTGMLYSAYGSGVWKTADFPVKNGESIHFHGPGRASGVPVVAGLVRREEILSGEIHHKLAMATWHNAYRQYVFPAAWTDGFRDGGLPEGAVLQLNPALNPADYGLSAAAACIARAMQRYGMVNVDNAGANAVYVEQLEVHGLSWDGILNDDDLKRIPLSQYRVLKLGEIHGMGDVWHREEQGLKP